MAISDLTIIRRSLTSRLFSTVTTALTVAVAVGLLLVLLSTRDAGEKAFQRGSGNMHLLVSRESSPMVSVLNGIFYANMPGAYLLADDPRGENDLQRVAADPRVAFAIPVQQGDSYEGLPVLATTPEFFTRFEPAEGEPWAFAAGESFDAPFEVVLGARAARESGLRVGDTVHLAHGRSDAEHEGEGHVHDEFAFAVVGVLGPTGSAHDRALFTDLVSAWTVHAHDRRLREDDHAHTTPDDLTEEDRKITGIYVRAATRPGASASGAVNSLAYALRSEGFMVAEPGSEIPKLFEIVGGVNAILVAMSGVVLVSGAISIMIALYSSMEQRRRQIAVLRVLGASRARIFGLVLTESAALGLLGALAGVALGVAGGGLAAAALKAELGVAVTPVYPPEWVLLVIVAAVALASVAGVVPAVAAYRTSVARNLRPAA
ncbi:MAG TPA: FtsX-like permease family protein [Phycisphaerales bacterium]|nr:FtsX-like permease family protein [Phycisphaerales bacterium]